MATAGRGSRTRGETPAGRLTRRLGLAAVVVALLAFAIEGGEYGTSDLLSRTERRAELVVEVERLQHTVDSLTAQLTAVEQDPVTLERIAREEYGMVRGDRELLYRFADDIDADSVRPR